MDKKKLGIIIAAVVIGASTLGGFVYSSHVATAKAAIEKKTALDNITKQQDLEEAAQKAKEGAPVVSVVTSKIVPKEPQVVASVPTPTTQDNSKATTSSTPISTAKEQPKPTTPSVPAPAISTETVSAITSLSEADIQHLQSYAQYSGDGVHGTSSAYHSFEDMYVNDRGSCDKLSKDFTPITLSDYSKAKAVWLGSPRLIYRNAISQYSIRGILSLTYYSDNKFGLTPNVTYQREVEYRLRYTDALRLENIKYLSEFKAVR